ncbi:hypothetical protein ACIP1U_32265 [Cupriavidus sp. NPDC089707]|uniref:hypothetical protein n=1 Tax=Cupriavidus sp. NPDC089707 TaxID=3363963 RepID=UPI00381DB4CD
MHPDERQLAKKMAANSQGKYTAEQIEAQMRLSDVVDMNGNVLESGRPDQIDAATTKPYDSGAQWVSVAGTTQIRELQAQGNAEIIAYIQSQQKTMQGDVPYASRQDYSNVVKYSNSMGQLPTGKCGAGQAACAAGLQKDYSPQEIADRRTNVADVASSLSQQAGRVSAAAGAAAAVPGIHQPGAVVTALGATAFGLTASAIEQIARPNAKAFGFDSTVDLINFTVSERYPMGSPVFNEVAESVKGSEWAKPYKAPGK